MLNKIYSVKYWEDTEFSEERLFLFAWNESKTYPIIKGTSIHDAAKKLYSLEVGKDVADITDYLFVSWLRCIKTVRVYIKDSLNPSLHIKRIAC